MIPIQNDNGKNAPDGKLRDYAIDTTLERIDSASYISSSEKRIDEVVIGTRTLSQFLGIFEPALKQQLSNKSPMEQDFLTQRYLERLHTSGSLGDAGRDLANCLNYGADYDLKLSRTPKMQFAPATPGMNMGGGMGGSSFIPSQTYSAPEQQQQYPTQPESTWKFPSDDDKS